MNIKAIMCLLLVGVLLCFSVERDVFASDVGLEEVESIAVEMDTATGSALVVSALEQNYVELQNSNLHLKNITALLLLLVLFEILRIVRSWSKGLGVK